MQEFSIDKITNLSNGYRIATINFRNVIDMNKAKDFFEKNKLKVLGKQRVYTESKFKRIFKTDFDIQKFIS